MNQDNGLASTALILGFAVYVMAMPQISQHRSPASTQQATPAPGGEARVVKVRRIFALTEQAEAAIQQGNDALAEAICHQALAVGNDSTACVLLAQIYDRHNRINEAIAAYHALFYAHDYRWSSISADPNTHFRYVLALLRGHQWPEAVNIYEKAIQVTLRVEGHPLFEQQFDSQIPDYSRLEAVAHLGLGIIRPSYAPAYKPDQLSHLKAAIGLEPRWALAQYSYGQALEKAGRIAEAQMAYAKAAKLGDGQMTGRSEEAMKQLKIRQKYSRVSSGN